MTDTESNQTITLIGATGGMGSHVAAEFRRRGITIRAIVRETSAIEADDHTELITSDVYDATQLAKALAGTDVIVSAWNPGWSSDNLYDQYIRGARNILEAAREARVGRLLVIGGASSLLDDSGREMIENGLPPEPYGSGVKAARDYLHEIRSEVDIDWVYLSPPADCGPMGPKGREGVYRTGGDTPVLDSAGRNSISQEDLAVAVVDQIVEPTVHRARYTVGY